MFPRGRYCNTPYLEIRAKVINPKISEFSVICQLCKTVPKTGRLEQDSPCKGPWCEPSQKCPRVPTTGGQNETLCLIRDVILLVPMSATIKSQEPSIRPTKT